MWRNSHQVLGGSLSNRRKWEENCYLLSRFFYKCYSEQINLRKYWCKQIPRHQHHLRVLNFDLRNLITSSYKYLSHAYSIFLYVLTGMTLNNKLQTSNLSLPVCFHFGTIFHLRTKSPFTTLSYLEPFPSSLYILSCSIVAFYFLFVFSLENVFLSKITNFQWNPRSYR